MGHQCKRQLLLLEGRGEEEVEDEEGEEVEGTHEEGVEDNGEISLHALKGVTNNKIIKVEWKIKEGSLSILIDIIHLN